MATFAPVAPPHSTQVQPRRVVAGPGVTPDGAIQTGPQTLAAPPDAGYDALPHVPASTPIAKQAPQVQSPIQPVQTAAPPVVPPAQGSVAGMLGRPQDLKSQLTAKMSELLGQGPASLDDPDLRGVVNANRTAGMRAQDRARTALAERNAARGRTGGANETDILGIEQARGERDAGFEANLLRDETLARRDQLMNVMTMAGQTLDADTKNRITEELGKLDAEVKRYGISEGGRQFDADLGFRTTGQTLDEAFRNRSLASGEGQAGAARGESARQFDIRTAQDQAQWEAEMQFQQLMAALGLGGM